MRHPYLFFINFQVSFPESAAAPVPLLTTQRSSPPVPRPGRSHWEVPGTPAVPVG